MQENIGFRIEALTPALAARIPGLAYRTFGYSYTDSRIYDPARLLRETADGRFDLLICTDADGEPRAMVNLDFYFPSPRIAEIDKLMVDPEIGEAQAGPVLKLLLGALRTRLRELSESRGMRAVISLEVTAHQLTQRLVREMGFATAGLFLGRAPGWQSHLKSPPPQRGALAVVKPRHPATPQTSSGRTTEILSVRPFRRNAPRQILNVPKCFDAQVREIYRDFQLPFEFAAAEAAPEGRTEIQASVDFAVGVAQVEVRRLGSDFTGVLIEQLDHYRSGFIDVVHFVLPLSATDIDGAVQTLRDAGCVFAGVLPEFRDGPVLILQSVDKDKLAGIESGLLSPRAASIWESAMGSGVAACARVVSEPVLSDWIRK